MANITVTYSFSNATTADATEVNTNFQDIIDGTSDGTKDFSIAALTCAGTLTANGNINLGNATSDDLTITARIASDLDPKTAASNTLGDATQTWQALYLDNTATDGGAIYFDGGSTENIKATADGTELDINGFSILDLNGAEIKTFGLYDEAKSADYTITDTDGISVIYMTTGATDRTATLPTAADNAGRTITMVKVDSGAGLAYWDGEGSETVNGNTGDTLALISQYDRSTVQCNGTAWFEISGYRQNRWQKKELGSTLTASTDPISDLGFSNLVVGRTYKLTLHARLRLLGTSGSENAYITATHNSVVILRIENRLDNNPGTNTLQASDSVIFVAAATTVTFALSETGTIDLRNDSIGTFSLLEELQNYDAESSAF